MKWGIAFSKREDYLMREQQEQEEDRYRKLDAAIRQRGTKARKEKKKVESSAEKRTSVNTDVLLCNNTLFRKELTLGDSAYRAVASAGTAGNAGVRVDVVLSISLRDSAYRAVGFACSTGNACIRNYICP